MLELNFGNSHNAKPKTLTANRKPHSANRKPHATKRITQAANQN